jgi:decaprenylphospho-beta-D-ribofuranose 2-oxidase
MGARVTPDPERGLAGWGRTYLPGVELRHEAIERFSAGKPLARGLGRSYGDASLLARGDAVALGTTLADRILAFDEATGRITVEPGLVLAELNRIFFPRLWFTPVTPGTKFVTVGGMVASDVHGKNHHVSGTFGRHVESLVIRTGRGRIVQASRSENADLFLATLGGMGLTGHILQVTFKMRRIPSTWMVGESHRVDSLEELLQLQSEKAAAWPYTAAWCDTVRGGKARGRGILFLGRWAEPSEAKPGLSRSPSGIPIPFELPSGLLNRFTISVFNELVYRSHFRKVKQGIITPDACFYPLDAFTNWNRAYGKRGVTQHQSVVAKETGKQALLEMMAVLERAKTASFLTVVKDCGPEGDGLLSFPKPGISLALDIPITSRAPEIVRELNRVVLAHQGRVYLTKDGLSSPEDFARMEPRLERFFEVKRRWDPDDEFRSAQSERLFGLGARSGATSLGN